MKVRVDVDIRGAEHIAQTGPNELTVRWQDGREVVYEDVEIYFPDVVRYLYKNGHMTRAAAKKELRRCGVGFRRSAHEPGLRKGEGDAEP